MAKSQTLKSDPFWVGVALRNSKYFLKFVDICSANEIFIDPVWSVFFV